MKLYFVESATADNYILAETRRGILCDRFGPDGCFAGIDLCTCDTDPETIVSAIREAIDPDIDEYDLDCMGEPILDSIDDFMAEQERLEYFQQDELYFIGEYGKAG